NRSKATCIIPRFTGREAEGVPKKVNCSRNIARRAKMSQRCPVFGLRFVVVVKYQPNKTKIMSTNTDGPIVQTYLFFNGNCEEALEFYKKALGAEVLMIMRFKDSPEAPPPGRVPPGYENKIMHSSFRVGQTVVMASDGCDTEKATFKDVSLSLT